MRTFVAIILAALAGILAASAFPWLPLLARASIIGCAVTAAAVLRPRSREPFILALLAPLVADGLTGSALGVRSLTLCSTLLFVQSILLPVRLPRDVRAVIAVAAAIAVADRVLVPFLTDAAAAIQRFGALAGSWWWAVVGNGIVGLLALHSMRRHSSHAIV